MSETDPAIVELAGFAEQYQTRTFDEMIDPFEVNRSGVPLADARTGLKVFFRLYGFNRAGGMKAGYQHRAVSALERTESEGDIDPDELWDNFQRECEKADTAVYEQMNRGVVTDAARLANREGNLFRWVGRELGDHGRLTVPYEELTSIHGVGPSITKFFLRDAVWLADATSDLRRRDRHRLQPMTTWVTRTARLLWPELGDADDETLAKRIVDECAENAVCPIEFNQGVWYFARETMDGDAERLEAEIRRMRNSRPRPPRTGGPE